ncbi:helix-turn-helix transcriptional regulator [Citricoccus zhacaiensis]|uniref:helix-turn-helix transcriptional regulator n=1 Tax=Citricoccus zhacaiensis TaxID=489142 RepID=UPI001663E1C5|nr:helix-turn-helix transcriptional regulator [Citricoccus zhacaiensis]
MTSPADGSGDAWQFLTDRVHRVLQIVSGLARKRYSPGDLGSDLPSLDAALIWAENFLRTHGPQLPRTGVLDGPQVARDVLLEVVDLRGRLVTTAMASRHEMMHRVDQSLQRLRAVDTLQDFIHKVPQEIVSLGYVRSLFSWADGLHWVAQSAHSVQGEDESRRLVEAGRQQPFRDLRDYFEYEMIRERHSILRHGIRKSRRVHPELLRATEAEAFVASPLIAGDAVVGFVNIDANATTGSVDDFDRGLLSIHTAGAGIILERLHRARHRATPPEHTAFQAERRSRGGFAAREMAPVDQLTVRESEILHWVAAGLTNAEIGRELTITEGTAKTHVRNVFRKLGVSNRTQAAALYRRGERG